MNESLNVPPDVQVIWDPRPDVDGIKKGDSFCFLRTLADGENFFWKEYPYDRRIISRYHELQNQVAQGVNGVILDTGHRVRVLCLPDIGDMSENITFLSPYQGCRVEIPFVSGNVASNPFCITRCVRTNVPDIKIQNIPPVNCRQTKEEVVITDIAWDIPTFLLQNPSADIALEALVADTYREWSQYMREVFHCVD